MASMNTRTHTRLRPSLRTPRQTSLLRSSAFRGALVYLAVFLAMTGGTLAFLYSEMARSLSQSADRLVWQEAAVLSRLHAMQGTDALQNFVATRGQAGGEMVYFLADGLGTRLAGNLAAFPTPEQTSRTADDWVTFTALRGDTASGMPVRGRVVVLDDDLALLVARDITPQTTQLATLLRVFVGAMGGLLLVGLFGSVVLARRTLARVEIITESLRDIMQGRFDTRVKMAGSGDEMTLLADQLNAMTARVDALMSSMREVTDNIAHDLRTPLNRLRGQLELVHAQLDDASASRDPLIAPLEQCMHDIDALLENFAALLSLSRMESGAVARETEDVDLNAVVADIAELYAPAFEEAGARLDVVMPEGPVRILGARALISQAIANLVENALKYACVPKHAITLELSQRATQTGVFFDICVRDCGPGIAAPDRARAKARFVRLEPSRHLPGSGIGLSLVQAIAQVHGGELTLRDNDPHGLVATLTMSAGAV